MEILQQSEALGAAIPSSERSLIERAYEDLLREILFLRERLVTPAEGGVNMLQRAHMEILNSHLPQICPPPPACATAIFTKYADDATDELVVWGTRSSSANATLEALLVVRQPSILLLLQGLFSWSFDLADPDTWPRQLPQGFEQAVYLCIPNAAISGESSSVRQRPQGYSAHRAPGPAGFESAFRFCSVPAALATDNLRCSSPVDSSLVPVDSYTPGSGLQEDIFAEWEVEARDAKVLTAICGNGEIEFGEVCDEGLLSSDGCLSCRAVSPGYKCKANTSCTPLCADGLLFQGMEECDDGGMMQGCSTDCKLLACQRQEVGISSQSVSGASWTDPELMATLREVHLVPAKDSSQRMELQGYVRCFSSVDPSPDLAVAFADCQGATRLSFLGEVSAGRMIRHDVELETAFDPVGDMHYEAGPYQLRARSEANGTEILLSCKTGFLWHQCRFWAVQLSEETTATASSLSQDGLSAAPLEFTEGVLEIWIPPDSSRWLCEAADRVSLICGDGKLAGPEECDDGNTDSGDGCSASCLSEPGFLCPEPGISCSEAWCGDGVAGDLPTQCDVGSQSLGCQSCTVSPGWLCHENCSEPESWTVPPSAEAAGFVNMSDDADSDDNSASLFFSPTPEFCCLEGPKPRNSSCILGQDCQVFLELPSSSTSGLLITPGLGVCGDQAMTWDGMANPSMVELRDGLQFFNFGRPLMVPVGNYALCWGPDPAAPWATEVFNLRGQNSTTSGALRRKATYPFDVGRLILGGPKANQVFSCTLGVPCDMDLEGYHLPAESAVLAVFGSCSDDVLRPASVDYVRLRVDSGGAGDGDVARFFWNETEVPVEEASDMVFVVFNQFQQGSPIQFGFNASSMRSSDVVHALRSVADQSLVLAAAKGLVSPLGTFAPRLLAQLTAMGAQQLSHANSYVSYALALSGGRALAEQGAGPGEGPVVIQEFVSTVASPKVAETAGRIQFGRLHGHAGIFTLCWESQLTRWSSWRGQGFKVDVGHLQVEGPFPGTWTCFAGSPCTVTLQGQALVDFALSEITLESGPDSGHAARSDGSEDSDAGDSLTVIGWHRGPLAGQVRDTGGEPALEFSLGVALERKLVPLAVYWRAAPSTEWTFIGKLHLEEHLCRLADEGPGEAHNCSDVPFGASCVSRCLAGWTGPVNTLVCEADGQLTGSQPDCRESRCDSVSLHAFKEQEQCRCSSAFFGNISWHQDLQMYMGSCRSCQDALLACEAGHFRDGCGGLFVGECKPCIGLALGNYFTSHGGLQATGCLQGSCVRCAAGQYTSGCGGTFPGECNPCTNSPNVTPPTNYYSSDGGVTGECALADCLRNCPVGQYRKDCGGTSPGFCATCARPPSGRFLSSSGGLEDACKTSPCPECLPGFYRTGCSMTDEGACVPCSNGPGEGFYYYTHGGTRNNCSFTACSDCSVGWYRRGCAASYAGECHQCTFKPPETYYSGHGGVRNQCPYSECGKGPDECPLGQYRDNCGTINDPTNSGICKNCTQRAQDHYFTGHGGTSPRGCPQEPCQACSVGFYRLGCGIGGTSPGSCEPCRHTADHYFTSHGGLVLEVGEGVVPAECPQASCWNSSSNCPAGYRLGGCGEDEHHVSPGNCLPCGAGTYTSLENWHEPCLVCEAGYFSLRGATACSACPSGKFTDSEGQSACSWCIGGSTNTEPPRNSCTECVSGKFNPVESRIDECQECIGGEVRRRSVRPGAVDCTECIVGYFDNDASDGESCTQCVGGEVRRRRATSCTGTPSGMYNEGDRDEARECIGGWVRRRYGSSCTACGDGFWDEPSRGLYDSGPDDCQRCVGEVRRRTLGQLAFTATQCDACDPGKYNERDGVSDSCSQCHGNVVDGGGGCSMCEPGTYKSAAESSSDVCLPCLGGLVLGRRSADEYSTCEPCPSGRYKQYRDGDGHDHCDEIPAGYEVQHPQPYPWSEPGQIVECGPGWARAASHVDACVSCAGRGVHLDNSGLRVGCNHGLCSPGYNDGTFDHCETCNGDVQQDSQFCQPCDSSQHKYNPGPGLGCQDCRGGTVVDGECVLCKFVYPVFYFRPDNEDHCRFCLGGEVEPNLPTACAPCGRGYYVPAASNTCIRGETCQISPDRTQCTACLPGRFKYDTTGDDCEACKPGHTGQNCELFESGTEQCEDAYYKKASHCTMQHGMHLYRPATCWSLLSGCAGAESQCRGDGYTSPLSCTTSSGYYDTAPTCKYLHACVIPFVGSKGYECYDATCAARPSIYSCRRC
ncbi:unnamed protein product [Symbiodinium sp. CCMP2592]|nr:unnamed protein product [Symbiodinium sp. CCMP2592]